MDRTVHYFLEYSSNIDCTVHICLEYKSTMDRTVHIIYMDIKYMALQIQGGGFGGRSPTVKMRKNNTLL